MNPAYHFGYAGWAFAELYEWLQARNALLADIRLVPLSRDQTWRKYALQRALASRYEWIPALGNINYKSGGPIALKDAEVGLSRLHQLLTAYPVVVMCACRDAKSCHRIVVVDHLQKAGVEVHALTSLAVPRHQQRTLI